jgi:hypothetical protein
MPPGVRRNVMSPTPPHISIAKMDYGPYPEAGRLNPKLAPDAPLLLATLDIEWHPRDPGCLLHALEQALLEFAPRFGRHQCRGERAYHVFAGGGPGSGRRGVTAPVEPTGSIERQPFDPLLALAHLLEHAVIEIQTTITAQATCSGLTGAHRDPANRFDLMVECRDARVGRCSLALALAWLTSALEGNPPGSEEKDILAAARFINLRAGGRVTRRTLAGALRLSEQGAARALEALEQVGYLSEARYTMNLSGIPEYRIAAC